MEIASSENLSRWGFNRWIPATDTIEFFLYGEDELRFLSEYPEALGYDFCYTGEDLQRLDRQKTLCVQCPGLQECPWQGWQMHPTIAHDLRRVYFGVDRCTPSAKANADAVYKRAQVKAGIPIRYRSLTAEAFDPTGNITALMAAKSFLTGGGGLFIYGGRGTGKTMLASIIVNKLLRDGRDAIFVTMPMLCQQLRSAIAREEVEKILLRLVGADVMVIDDLGSEQATAWTLEQLFNVVNERYNANGEIIITSNLAPSSLRSQWSSLKVGGGSEVGERIYSRLCEMCVFVQMQGNDRRLSST